MKRQSQVQPFESVADLEALFAECDRLQLTEQNLTGSSIWLS